MSEKLPGGVVGPPEPQPLGEERALREEETRSRITTATLIIFGATIILSFIGAFIGQWAEVKELLDVILPLEATLIGGVAGYYLGTGTQP